MKMIIKAEQVFQMRGNMFSKNNIDKTLKCKCCKKLISDSEKGVGMVIFKGELKKSNALICNDCVLYLEEQGVVNLEYKIKEEIESKDKLIKEYKEILIEMEMIDSNLKSSKIEKMSVKELKETVINKRIELFDYKQKQYIINNVDTSKWEKLEPYLEEQYFVIEDKEFLKHESQIDEYFKDTYSDYFDCGQGYYEDEVELLVHIGKKFYEVTINVEIGSSKQERGDRLYWVEALEKISYIEISKPTRKEEFIHLSISETDIERVKELLNSEGILWKE